MRKLAAIMFTDIVGCTALMGKDEEQALQLLQKNRGLLKPIIEQFRGEWLKEMGDGTLSSFASAVDAVNCALAIQQVLKDDPDLKLRIGIHVGDVVVEGGDVFGDGVNVASRLEPLAEPGGICVSERVYEDIRNKSGIEAASQGEKTLKGVARPITAYAILWDGTGPDHSVGTKSGVAGPSIAVLPFTDMSQEQDQEYFCDGMAEELLDALSRIKDLRVAARTSSFSFKGQQRDIREIGDKLNAATVLEGSVRKAGKRLRITAQLINVADGYHVWSEKYDRELKDIFAIQDEIAGNIVRALRIMLSESEKHTLEELRTDNIEAYDYYLRGRKFFYEFRVRSFDFARQMFTRATQIDPNYALGYAGIADSCS